ncbi:MAG: low molecular weight phosphotyrosine protein phosphatase [Eubacterium sp.]|nr:low molecular weight phosphotyrosine protein phosphatase [Eubacterium sp.]
MLKILFICHGNICRSTMAQFVFQHMVNEAGLSDRFYIDSAATSREEIGNGPHRGTVQKCKEVGVPVLAHRAKQVTRADYEKYDLLIIMDEENRRGLRRIISKDPQGKVHKLMDYAGEDKNVADPWYTGDFEATYRDVSRGCAAMLKKLQKEG